MAGRSKPKKPDVLRDVPNPDRVRATSRGPYDYAGVESDLPAVSGHGRRLTPELIRRMAQDVALGEPIPTCAVKHGCGTVYRNWAQTARRHEREQRAPGWGEGESPELAWLLAMDVARADFEGKMVRHIGSAAEFDWKAAAWLLERKAPRRWFLQHQMTLIAQGQKQAEINTMSLDRLLKLAQGVMETKEIKVLQATNADTLDQVSDAEILDAEVEKT